MGEIAEYGGTAMPASYWNNLINQSILRLTKAIPIGYVTRMDTEGLIYYEEPYYICRLHATPGHYVSMVGMYSFGYGTYQWKAKIANPGVNSLCAVGCFERHHGWADEGLISLSSNQGTYLLKTSEQGLTTPTEQTDLGAEDWTTEKTFKIIWSASSVAAYVDDVLKATHTRAVPAEPLGNLFFEVGTPGSTPPAGEPTVYFREQSFEKL